MSAQDLLLAQQLTDLLAGFPGWARVALALTAALAIALVIGEVAARVTRAAIALFDDHRDTGAGWIQPLVAAPIRLVRAAVFLIVALLLVLPALEVAGIPSALGPNLESVTAWFFRTGLRILIVCVLAYVATRLVSLLVGRFEERMSAHTDAHGIELARRARTLGSLVRRALTTLVVGIATLMILRQLQIDIMPILTGAGIVGLAVGFGAQTLVKDVISGFFLIFENQIRVGDVASINGTGGAVESITLRTIVLRDLAGTVHVFPNGSITTLSNLTKDFSYYVIDVRVAYHEDTDEVAAVLAEVGAELAADPTYARDVLGDLEILGVDGFAPSEVVIKVRIKTVPLRQWTVGRELRRRIKKAFDARGIEMPFPHLSIYAGEATRPWPVLMASASDGGGGARSAERRVEPPGEAPSSTDATSRAERHGRGNR